MPKIIYPPLKSQHDSSNLYEIGIDEAGRGPLFGRLYVAAVVLPKDDSFLHKDIKDSKKIHSRKKITELSEYIRNHAAAYHVQYIEHTTIDTINIRQSVFQGMHECVRNCIQQLESRIEDGSDVSDKSYTQKYMLLVDGNDFKPYVQFDDSTNTLVSIPHQTFEGGDNTYIAIAAASILAKSARDQYIEDLCLKYPELSSRYGLEKNMGYGTKQHLTGILEHGITQWHRRTYGRCKEAEYCPLDETA